MAVSRQRQWQKSNPIKAAANASVAAAVASGRLLRPEVCEACGTGCLPDGHHDDYSMPLAVRWLCARCHRTAHAQLKGRVVPMRVVAFRLAPEQVAAVAAIAKREQRSFGGAVRILLTDALARRMRRLRKAA